MKQFLSDDYSRIDLGGNKYTLIDNDDIEKVNKNCWLKSYDGYAVRNSGSRRYYLHRVILNAKVNEFVDHINGNKLDNRKCNLRIVTKSKNNQNKINKYKEKTSLYKGVHKKNKKWIAQIQVNYKKIYLGEFANEILAKKAYKEASIKYHKDFGFYDDKLITNINFELYPIVSRKKPNYISKKKKGYVLQIKGKYIGYRKTLEEILKLKESYI